MADIEKVENAFHRHFMKGLLSRNIFLNKRYYMKWVLKQKNINIDLVASSTQRVLLLLRQKVSNKKFRNI